jgi:hypothetical protein
MRYILPIPVLAIVIAAYLLMAPGGGMFLDGDAYSMVLPSGVEITLRGSEIFLIAGLIALFLDLMKARHAGRLGRMLAGATVVVAIACLLFYSPAASPAVLLLALMALVLALVALLRR